MIENGGKFDIGFSIQKETQIFCCKWDTENFYKFFKNKVTKQKLELEIYKNQKRNKDISAYLFIHSCLDFFFNFGYFLITLQGMIFSWKWSKWDWCFDLFLFQFQFFKKTAENQNNKLAFGYFLYISWNFTCSICKQKFDEIWHLSMIRNLKFLMKQLNIGQSNAFHCKQSIDLYQVIM